MADSAAEGEAKPFLGCGMGEAITGMGSRLPDALCFQFLFLKPILTITRLKNTPMTMKAFFSIFTCGMGETTTRMGQGSLMRVRQVEHPMDIKFDTIGMGTSSVIQCGMGRESSEQARCKRMASRQRNLRHTVTTL